MTVGIIMVCQYVTPDVSMASSLKDVLFLTFKRNPATPVIPSALKHIWM